MQYYCLKFLCGFSLIGLLGTACKKEEKIALEKPVSIPSVSGVHFSRQKPKDSTKPVYRTNAESRKMLESPQQNFQRNLQQNNNTSTSKTTKNQHSTSSANNDPKRLTTPYLTTKVQRPN